MGKQGETRMKICKLGLFPKIEKFIIKRLVEEWNMMWGVVIFLKMCVSFSDFIQNPVLRNIAPSQANPCQTLAIF